jgi:hypothetical protein
VLGVPFVGRDGERRGREADGRWWSLTPTILEMKRGEELIRHRASAGEVETVGRRIDSASSERGRVAANRLRRGGVPEGWRQLG